jgi:hypothetical protein
MLYGEKIRVAVILSDRLAHPQAVVHVEGELVVSRHDRWHVGDLLCRYWLLAVDRNTERNCRNDTCRQMAQDAFPSPIALHRHTLIERFPPVT